jgi:hypothetical protein
MATWQFDFVLVPRTALADLPVDATAIEDSRPYWVGHARTAVLSWLGPLGVPQSTWTEDMVMWGSEETTCVSLLTEAEVIDELRVRLDLREPPPEMLDRALAIARSRDWIVITESGVVLEPTLDAVLHASKGSSAGRFVEDPRKFLDELRGGKKDE